MKRWLLAVVVLLAGFCGLVNADYIIIVADLGAANSKNSLLNRILANSRAAGAPAGVGGGMMGGGMGRGGMGGGGMAGGGMGRGGMGGGMGRGGMGGGGMGRGALGGGGMGGGGYGPGGMGGGGMFPRNPAGQGINGGGRGPGGGLGGGAANGGKGANSSQSSGQLQLDDIIPNLLVMAVVESNKVSNHILPYNLAEMPFGVAFVGHKWGRSMVLPLTLDGRIAASSVNVPSLAKRLDRQYKALHVNGSKPSADELLSLAEWALRHGMLNSFHHIMKELTAQDSNHPAVLAYQTVREQIAKPLSQDDTSAHWRAELKEYRIATSHHYALLHNDKLNSESIEVKYRLERLEHMFSSFFYWFALKGKVMPFPNQRQVAILVSTQEEFERQHQIFDSAPLAADGFAVPHENLMVFSLLRIDPASVMLRQRTSEIWNKGFTPEQLLRSANIIGLTLDQKAEYSTIALLEKALEEDSIIATVSHQAARQLMSAIGMFPRYVAVPQWTQFGVGSFFETHKGSPWTNMTGPSWIYLRLYKHWIGANPSQGTRHLDAPEVVLQKVITDAYFREATANDKDRKLRLKAETLAWSLTYFLAHQKLDGLFRYCDELNKLPRDIEFDDKTLLLCFARAFDLLAPNDPNLVDSTKLKLFAAVWENNLKRTLSEGDEIYKELVQLRPTDRPQNPSNSTPPNGKK